MKHIAIILGDISRFGGTERAVVNLANSLVKKKKRVSLVCVYENKKFSEDPCFPLDSRILIESIKINVPKNKITRFINYFKVAFFQRKLCQTNKFDFIMGTSHATNCLLPIVVLGLKTKSLGMEHLSRLSLPLASRIFQRFFYPFLNGLILLSETSENNYKFCKRKFVIANSLPFFPENKSTLNNKRILNVGRLSKEKGIERLIELAPLFLNDSNIERIDIYGNGEEEKTLKLQIVDNNLSEFVYLNNAVSDIENEYVNSSLYVMTSHYEAFPMVLLEAKSCGLPVVAFDCPEGPKEIINDGVDGFLIENGNLKQMAEKISLLMSDFELREQFGINARKSVIKYSEDVIVSKWENLFENI